jgi:hypothetical protein
LWRGVRVCREREEEDAEERGGNHRVGGVRGGAGVDVRLALRVEMMGG